MAGAYLLATFLAFSIVPTWLRPCPMMEGQAALVAHGMAAFGPGRAGEVPSTPERPHRTRGCDCACFCCGAVAALPGTDPVPPLTRPSASTAVASRMPSVCLHSRSRFLLPFSTAPPELA